MNDRVAVITGASRGLGAAVARAFSAHGAKVGLLSRSGDDLGLPDALGVVCDVRDRTQVDAGVAAVVERFGTVDCAVANAGVGTYGPFLEMEPDAIDDMIDVNLKGTIHLAHATLPHLVAAGGGDFVSVASVAGLRAFPGEAGYNASKFGQLGFTRALDHELRDKGVRCVSVCPGGIATEFAMGSGRTEDSIDGMMSADEAAEAVVFCVTRPAGYRMLTVSYRPMNEGSWG